MNKVNVQHRVAPRPKQCPICKKPVTKADFDGKKATYTHVPERKELGLRWQHLACKSACEFVERAAGQAAAAHHAVDGSRQSLCALTQSAVAMTAPSAPMTAPTPNPIAYP